MGCCKSLNRAGNRVDATYVAAANPQILFLGLDGAGKTTLFYKTLMPEWHTIAGSMEPTKAFHFEQIHRNKLKIFLWDLSGHPSLRAAWSSVYRYINVWGVVYVVNLLDLNESRIAENRALIQQLITDSCLRNASVTVIFNTFGSSSDGQPQAAKKLAAKLGLHAAAAENKSRVTWYLVDCQKGEDDTRWNQAFRAMLDRFHRILFPPPAPPTKH